MVGVENIYYFGYLSYNIGRYLNKGNNKLCWEEVEIGNI